MVAFGHLEDENIPERTIVHHAHNGTRAFLVALNVATIGLFYWALDPWAHPVYGLAEGPEAEPVRTGALVVAPQTVFEVRKDLTDLEVQNALIIFGMLARESPTIFTNGPRTPATSCGHTFCPMPPAPRASFFSP
jgi:hypothetical protein